MRLCGPSGAVSVALALLLSLSACGSSNDLTVSGQAGGAAQAPASRAAATASSANPAAVPYEAAFCDAWAGLKVSSDKMGAEFEAAGEADLGPAVLAAADEANALLGRVSTQLDDAEPPTFDGGEELADRVARGTDAAKQGIEQIRQTVLATDPSDPDYRLTVGGQGLGIVFALAVGPLSLIDMELSQNGVKGDALIEESAGYLGFLREARDRPQCAWLLEGSGPEVARLLDAQDAGGAAPTCSPESLLQQAFTATERAGLGVVSQWSCAQGWAYAVIDVKATSAGESVTQGFLFRQQDNSWRQVDRADACPAEDIPAEVRVVCDAG